MIQQKSWFVYKTTNTVSGRFYVGVHKGFVDDNYLGSGTQLKLAIKGYGRTCFKREVVKVCLDADDAYELEGLIVDKEFVERLDTYNLALGGRGREGEMATEDSKVKMRKPKSEAHRLAISAGKLGKSLTSEHIAAQTKGKIGRKFSKETKDKMRASRLKYLENSKQDI